MRVINKKKALYNSLMEGISRSLRNTLNEDNNGMHMDLHDDFTITQDENTAKSFVAYLKAINKKQRLSQEDECKLADIIQHSPNKRQVEAAKNLTEETKEVEVVKEEKPKRGRKKASEQKSE